jgi:opacity protein-like surface antigen
MKFGKGRRMNGIKSMLLLLLLTVNHFVFAAPPNFASPAESQRAREYTPPPGKALVYIYQRQQDGRGVSPTIWMNNYEIGRLVPGTFTVWKLAPGRLSLRVDGTKSASLSMKIQAGRIYRFRLSVAEETTGLRAKFRLVPETYRSELASTRLIKNPRDVSTVTAAPARPKTAKPAIPPATARETPLQTDKQSITTDQEEDKQTDIAWNAPIVPGGMGLMLKTGSLTLTEDRQTILAADRRFEESVSGLLAVELYYQFDSGLTLGGELIQYSAEFTTLGMMDNHDVDVTIILFNSRKYFRNYSGLQPYIGAGIGVAVTDISGPTIGGNTAGVAYKLLTGLEYRWAKVGLFGELNYIGADTEDDNNESVDVSGTGIAAGVVFHF